MLGLSPSELVKLVNRYIGGDGGYLGNFSYRTHADFYPEYCNLEINPYDYEGTTRERFIQILKEQAPSNQAKILRGILEKFQVGDKYAPETRTPQLLKEFRAIIVRLEQGSPVTSINPRITSAVVELAIKDSETSLQNGSALSGVDRVHTALHGYLREVCNDASIVYTSDDTITRLYKLLRIQHPALNNLGAREQDIHKILQGFAGILDALNPIRNNATLAHPNSDLLDKDEAMLVINAARTILHYLDAKFT